MVMTRAIAKLIQTDQTFQIPSQLQTNKDLGSQLMDQALLAALANRDVDIEDALSYAQDKRAFQKYMSDSVMLPKLDAAGT
jgi:twitching motility protein PilT